MKAVASDCEGRKDVLQNVLTALTVRSHSFPIPFSAEELKYRLLKTNVLQKASHRLQMISPSFPDPTSFKELY